jgi:hypothetical protein
MSGPGTKLITVTATRKLNTTPWLTLTTVAGQPAARDRFPRGARAFSTGHPGLFQATRHGHDKAI